MNQRQVFICLPYTSSRYTLYTHKYLFTVTEGRAGGVLNQREGERGYRSQTPVLKIPTWLNVRGVLGNKCAEWHNLKTVHYKEIIVSGNFLPWSISNMCVFCSILQGGSDKSGTTSELRRCIKSRFFILNILLRSISYVCRNVNRNKQTH